MENAKEILAAGTALTSPQSTGGSIPFVVVPQGYAVHDIERLMPEPERKRGVVTVSVADSYIAYLHRHATSGESMTYAALDAEAGSLAMVCVLNDNSAASPRWRDHRCQFTPKLSVEWSRWKAANCKVHDQAEFAKFLEDNAQDVAAVDGMPTGAQMLQMALEFEANADKRFKSKTNLQSGGVRIEFVDDETKDTRKSMQMFERFTIGIPVFDGSKDAYPIEARLKYRVKDGVLVFWFELIRPDRAFKTAANADIAKIESESGVPVIYGTP